MIPGDTPFMPLPVDGQVPQRPSAPQVVAPQVVWFDLHGPGDDPAALEDRYGTLSDIPIAGTLDEVWSANPGWFTSAGDNVLLQQGGTHESDQYFRADSWRSMMFSCWILVPPLAPAFTLWAYGNPTGNSSAGGISFSVTSAGKARLKYSGGTGDAPVGRLSAATIDDGQAHLVGGYFHRFEGTLYNQTFIDTVEQPIGSVTEGTWSILPDTGAGFFGRSSDAGLETDVVPAGVQVRDMLFVKSLGDLRFSSITRQRAIFDRQHPAPPARRG